MFVHSRSILQPVVLLMIVAVPMTVADDHQSPTVKLAADVNRASGFSASGDSIEGFTEPFADIELAASEMGALTVINVVDGSVVKAGQVIASLDDRVLRASLEVAKATATSTGELNSAQASLALRELEFRKLTELFGRQHASQQELDRASGDLKVARARLQIATDQATVRRLEENRILAQLQQRQIVSPIDGMVVEVMKDKGEFVSPSDPVVARVVQLDPLMVAFSVPSEQRNKVAPKQAVLLTVGKSTSVQGRVEYVSPIADASSGTFRVKVMLPNPAGRWHGGEKSVLHLDENSLKTASRPKRLASKTQK